MTRFKRDAVRDKRRPRRRDTLHAIEARSRPKLIGKLTHMLLIPLKDFPKRLDLTAFYDNISK